jgi:hypothetical protein
MKVARWAHYGWMMASAVAVGLQAGPFGDFYPLGIWGVPRAEDLAVVRAAGFNLAFGPLSARYLQAANALGMKVLGAPCQLVPPKFEKDKAWRSLRRYDSHPALWAWLMAEEPDLHLVAPQEVRAWRQFLGCAQTRKPTALVIFQGYSALDYGHLTDVILVDRYPIPWLPLANFGQHVRAARLAVGLQKPLVSVIQAFDWTYYPEQLQGQSNLRPPSWQEIRCMTYCALAERADGLLYYAFDDGRWQMQAHPDTWTALCAVLREVNERLPLFKAEHLWWGKNHRFADRSIMFNAALQSSITSVLLRVGAGDGNVPAGEYVLAVNNTEKRHLYGFTSPWKGAEKVTVLGEARVLLSREGWLTDEFLPYAVHVYGPGTGPAKEAGHDRNGP